MEKRSSKVGSIIAFGIVGLTGVLFTILSDLILLGRPDSAYSFLKLGTESMAYIPQWRITTGVFIGVVMLPFQIAGLIPLYYGLKPAGKVLPLITMMMNAHTLIMGVAFHMSYAYIASGWKLYYETGTGHKIASEMIKRFDYYWKIILIIMFTELLISSIIYLWIVMKGNTLFPKWMAIVNPICVILFMLPLILTLPAPIGGFTAPASLNISTMVYLSFPTFIIYKKIKNLQS